ncbi:MAG: DUF58 domain-containing protein [Verrucomicrobiales bacterium]|jgi:uncharacterized protein (DUF58 family)|nr:DUF58 domain-containing protein [Verrucomicrobiales bacterium]MBP9223937.1 DUF58 domain-containing protein [Verrucomicrobiales bacterium]
MPTFLDPSALMRVKSLELRARMVMEGFWKGIHRSPYHGFSVEFSEYRPYARGDDTRFIDWKVMARSDRAYIKKFEDETNLRAHLLLDRSRSMTYRSGEYSKADYAATFAATLAFFLMGQQDAVGLTTFDEAVDKHIPARNRPGQLRRLLLQLEQAPSGKGTDLGAAMKGLHELIGKRSLVVLVSDLLAPLEELEKQIGYFSAGRHEVAVFQILDPRELDFRFPTAVHFRDSESQRDLFIDPAVARSGYLERLQTHLDSIKNLCSRHGVAYRLVPTDEPLEQVLFEFVNLRNK